MPDFSIELNVRVAGPVCGVDEAGRGSWAGPVVAAAVILDQTRMPSSLATAIDDSKKLSRARREQIAVALPAFACIGIGMADVAEIERLNILWASILAMHRAVDALSTQPGMALIDGNRSPDLDCQVKCIIGGDRRSLSIAAASIIAKVTRDRMMCSLSHGYPGYGFERHVGYGTREHRAALLRLGPTPLHRLAFPSVQVILGQLAPG